MIKHGADVNLCPEGYVGAPLYIATRHNHIDVVKILLQNHADVNQCSGCYMETPAHVAVGYGHVEVLTVLLRHGAGVNTRVGNENISPLDAASWFPSKPKIKCILQLLNFGAAMDEDSSDRTKRVMSKIESLGDRGILFSVSERHFLYNLALCIALKFPGISKPCFMHIRALITYRNMFMCREFRMGIDSVWNDSNKRLDLSS